MGVGGMRSERVAQGIRALWPVARFAFGAPQEGSVDIALHRALTARAWSGVSAEAVAEAAKNAQVVVFAHENVFELRPLLAEAAAQQRRLDALLELGAAHASRVLRDVGPVALMKGSAAAAWVYPESAWRQRRDIDLLVGEALPDVRRVLLAHGWEDANDPRHGQDPNKVRAWNMSVRLGGGLVSFDLHRHLVHDGWCRPDIGLMLENRVEGRAAMPVTSAVDTMVNTAIHMLGTGFHEPLKGWIDLLRLLPLVTPEELAAGARAHGIVTGMWVCLGVLGRWFEAPVRAHRDRLGRPFHAGLLEYLTAGEHVTPERRLLPRGVSYRLWKVLVRDAYR